MNFYISAIPCRKPFKKRELFQKFRRNYESSKEKNNLQVEKIDYFSKGYKQARKDLKQN
jgi:hypothetical protein